MTLLLRGLKVHLALGYTDMRKGIDGLTMLVQGVLRQDPFSGHLFVFRGRKANLIKIVYWDGTGLCLFTKRLEQGVFLWPPDIDPGEILTLIDLAALPSDVDTLHQIGAGLGRASGGRSIRACPSPNRDREAQAHHSAIPTRAVWTALGTDRWRPVCSRPGGPRPRYYPLASAPSGSIATRCQFAACPHRQGPPDHLPREDVAIDIDDRVCPCCGSALHVIGETVSEMLDFVPARLRVLRIRRPKYGCRACGTIHQAAAPERPIAKGMASPGLLAHVLVSKY